MKRETPRYVTVTRSKGNEYFQFRRHGRAKNMECRPGQHDPGTPEFAAEYARLLNGIPKAPKGKTLSALITRYRLSDNFKKLAPRTRKDYDRVLTFLGDRLGQYPVADFERKDIIRLRDTNSDAVRFANYCVQVARILFERAIDLGWIKQGANPAQGVKLLKYDGEKREPWPDSMLAAYRAACPLGTRERTLEALSTQLGQRIADTLKMTWHDVKPDGVLVVQNKTSKKLRVPLTDYLREALEAAPREGVHILMNRDAKAPWAYRSAAQAVRKIRKKIDAERWDIHSWRHNAATELYEAGCDERMIEAVTGMTPETQKIYTRSARQIDLAREAQKRRENGNET